ncbi:hypothetical protein GS896_25700 [Rhodococcus hoagii]|nr:hypothetical protein [Prescottella equi]MBM4654099.1 hypothetical protein [Prescottella equi]NKR23372.1 hypothetical protein [Prescottella equi]NKT56017.1 hypothetical protein [Prescottella equi]NKU37359.1 hypothetical protein [Prescottella equi]
MIKRVAAGRARLNGGASIRGRRSAISGRYLAVASAARWPTTTVREVPQQVLVVGGPLTETAHLAVPRADSIHRTEWFEHLRTWVESFNVAAANPASTTTIEVAFTLDLTDVDAGLDDVTRVVRDHLEPSPSRATTMAMRADSANPDLIEFTLTSCRHRSRGASGDVADSGEDVASTDTVELVTATGPVSYALPLSLDRDTIGSVEVSQILSASDKPNRALANTKRKAHQLLGIKVANQYRYPTFQFDRERKLIKPQAMYANVAMECDFDPWGTLDWWYSCQPVLGDQRPVDLLDAGTLTESDIDRMIAHDRLGMD